MAVDKQRLDSTEPEPTHDIARVVRLLMRLTDTNLDTLAGALGVAKSAASARLNGHTRWAADDVARLAQLWGIEPGLFFLPIEKVRPSMFDAITRLKSAVSGKEPGQRLAPVKTHPRPRLTPDRAIVRGVPAPTTR